jgi:cation:H+ antiporter
VLPPINTEKRVLENVAGLLVTFVVILMGAELFTNGIEWAGHRLKLAEGAVGSLLAAVGTALPETLIPVVAIFFSRDARAMDVAVGAIAGAPFMLATLTLFVASTTVILLARGGRRARTFDLNKPVILRDLAFFLGLYGVAVLATFTPSLPFRVVVAAGLFLAYLYYAFATLRSEGELGDDLNPLHLTRVIPVRERLRVIGLQVILGLALIIAGAHFFVEFVQHVADGLGISTLVLALILTPIATELPEKANSILWIRAKKDTLAIGNITGAMVFQSSVPVALGVVFTPWDLKGPTLLSAVLALTSSGIVFLFLRRDKPLRATLPLVVGGVSYGAFLSYVFLVIL